MEPVSVMQSGFAASEIVKQYKIQERQKENEDFTFAKGLRKLREIHLDSAARIAALYFVRG